MKAVIKVTKIGLAVGFISLMTNCSSDDSSKDDTSGKGVITDGMAKAGIAWSDWWLEKAGGSGVNPQDIDKVADNGDYKNKYRCKSCHGWDLLGKKGGYSANAKGDANGRVTGFALAEKTVDADEVTMSSGRVKLDSKTWADHDATTMPDFGGSAIEHNKLTAEQVKNFVEFINNGPKLTDYATVTPGVSGKSDPVYKFINADVENGKKLYTDHCETCHGADGKEIDDLIIGTFFRGAGHYSEGFHKILYGNNGTRMDRKAQGNLSAEQARDILAYIQANDAIFVD